MKAKYFLGAVFMALLGASIALFAYTKIIEKPAVVLARDSSKVTPRGSRTFAHFHVDAGSAAG